MNKKNKKLRVAVLFGGKSAEHEVSLVGARSIIDALDKKKYIIMPVGITKDGLWIRGEDALNKLMSGNKEGAAKYFDPHDADIIFPILHGTFGEDGCLQGILEFAGVPYVGCGVLASSIGMDKAVQKQILRDAGLPVTPWLEVRKEDFVNNETAYFSKISSLGMPVFVKPANMGSSVGVHKAKDTAEVKSAINDAFIYDNKILIEKAILGAREIEAGLLGNNDPQVSVLGEIIPSGEFYDYNAKYVDGKSSEIIPAKLPAEVTEKIRFMAARAWHVLNCTGCARVDFLLEGSKLTPFINEINTLPGFTSISMYPKLWEASGLSYSDLLDELITLGLEAFKKKSLLKRSYRPANDWWSK